MSFYSLLSRNSLFPRNSLLSRWLAVVFIATLFGSAGDAHSQTVHVTSSSEFSISGTVLSSSTGSPVARCHVTATLSQRSLDNQRNGGTLAAIGGPGGPGGGPGGPGGRPGPGAGGARGGTSPQRDSTDTDEHGRFTLALPSAGTWVVRASATGYRSQAFDQHEGFYTAVVLTPQAPSYKLTFRIAPDSAITGLVVDEAGEPIRQAQVALFNVRRSGDGDAQGAGFAGQRASSANTDDRGRYELAGLAPGDYRLSVNTRPWYATNVQSINLNANANGVQPDTSLDVVYSPTWFPGTTDEDAAGTLTLREGETREADFQLTPMPAIHLRIPVPPAPVRAANQGPNNQPMNQYRPPQVERLSAGGNMPLSTSQSAGVFDIDGLTPGLYRIQSSGSNGQPGQTSIISISSNSSRFVDLTSTGVATTTVTLTIDGPSGADNLPITFTDASNLSIAFRNNAGRGGPGGGFGGPGGFGGGDPQQSDGVSAGSGRSGRPPRSVQLPPGRYVVTQEGSSNFYLSGMTQGKTEVVGRTVTVPAGDSALTLHISGGRANIEGVATASSAPAVGAMVLLVPITIDQPGSITTSRRDQTNTDGGFAITNVIPGQYILVAIDHGWNVNWRDPATLARYLIHGVPLDLRGPSTVKQNVDAQQP